MIKVRRGSGSTTLILQKDKGSTFTVLEEWTDRAAPADTGTTRLLWTPALLELAKLTQQLKAREADPNRKELTHALQ